MELQTIKKLIEIGIEKGLTTVEELMDDISSNYIKEHSLKEDKQENIIEVSTKNLDPEDIEDETSMKECLLKVADGEYAKGILPEHEEYFIVLEGSPMREEVAKSCPETVKLLREKLKEKGVVVNNRFTIDYRFNSLTQAANCLKGCSLNGKKVWKKID